ncbi:MAG: hypothetical protein K8T20_03070 [Planctomycetes bacterium]|nr:hypothetical protein [Planctomycetota bacterium]
MKQIFNSMAGYVGLSAEGFASVLLVAVLTVMGSFALCALFIVLMPADYLSLKRHAPTPRVGVRGKITYWTRNICGFLLAIVGLILAIPGVPFPGTLLFLIGFSITDFPSKRKLQRKLLKRPSVQGRINRLRKRFGKPPILLGC